MPEPKWIRFRLTPRRAGRKTDRWLVCAKDDDTLLGLVMWFARWRKYAFFPEEGRVFEATCLRDIAAFCEERTREHRTGEFRFSLAPPTEGSPTVGSAVRTDPA